MFAVDETDSRAKQSLQQQLLPPRSAATQRVADAAWNCEGSTCNGLRLLAFCRRHCPRLASSRSRGSHTGTLAELDVHGTLTWLVPGQSHINAHHSFNNISPM
jgi:hypothetical protein